MSDDTPFDEAPLRDLRRAVDQPLPMRGGREDELLDALLQDLKHNAQTAKEDTSAPGDLLELRIESEDSVERTLRRPRRSTTLALVAAIVAVLGGFAVVAALRGSPDVAPTPATSPPVPLSVPFETIEEACEAFAAQRPDFGEAFVTGEVDADDADALLTLYQHTLAETTIRFDVSADTVVAMERARGSMAQMVGSARAGDAAYNNLLTVDARLLDIAAADERFARCTISEQTTR